MNCEVNEQDGVLRIRGEMTIYNAAALKDELFTALEAKVAGCALNLVEVSEFDTTGLQILLMARKVCLSRGGAFSLANPSTAVRETLELLRGHNLPITETDV